VKEKERKTEGQWALKEDVALHGCGMLCASEWSPAILHPGFDEAVRFTHPGWLTAATCTLVRTRFSRLDNAEAHIAIVAVASLWLVLLSRHLEDAGFALIRHQGVAGFVWS
jgi:hypothetical protein